MVYVYYLSLPFIGELRRKYLHIAGKDNKIYIEALQQIPDLPLLLCLAVAYREAVIGDPELVRSNLEIGVVRYYERYLAAELTLEFA